MYIILQLQQILKSTNPRKGTPKVCASKGNAHKNVYKSFLFFTFFPSNATVSDQTETRICENIYNIAIVMSENLKYFIDSKYATPVIINQTRLYVKLRRKKKLCFRNDILSPLVF